MKDFNIKYSNMIKGIAIIMMVFHHLFWVKSFSQGYNLSFWPFTIGRVAQIASVFKICVPIFTFLSGYGLLCFYKKLKKKNNFFEIRMLKLLPTYFLIIVLSYVFIATFKTSIIKQKFFANNIYTGIFYIIIDLLGIANILKTPSICNEWWYIPTSIIFIFLLPLLYKLVKKWGWLNVFIGIVIFPRFIYMYNFSTTTAYPFLFSFLLGMYCQDSDLIKKIVNYKLIKNNIFNKAIKFFIYIFLMFILYLYTTHISTLILYEINFGLLPFVFILFCSEFIFPIKLFQFIFSYLGQYSYIMYLCHTIILSIIKDFLYSLPHFLISGIILTLISFIVSFIIKNILEKINFYKFFDNLIMQLKRSK